ncbi:hypothetical protein ABB37_07381 [Leptomonas pyrrhocoris]|uniref:Serine aminopeptidase S33 domain-containing protein n=1 Tax=Leptomonas pyrrhocoris TaxID=157538 RepID=A0A0M9FVX2_LEPPY|nr:hypothetical protein ABB37_07381 [Leptomonas pyrrhocoris]KPA77037.1 hypothetical protein ABB37_07381 [Leptomonas pyrrhocoris]|eukprot:XP_015655476.1 hypothetical protein ABB37_07381 [Leptomonas pyrrhocoris]
MTPYEVAFFIIHCILHICGYWIPCAVGTCVDLLLCRPCRAYEKQKHGFSYHPAREVRLIHNAESAESAVRVFGLMDACASTLEDRQFCSSPVPDTKAATEQAETNKVKAASSTRIQASDGEGASTSAFAQARADGPAPATTATTASGTRTGSEHDGPLRPSASDSAPPTAEELDAPYRSLRFPHPPSSSTGSSAKPATTTSISTAPTAKKALRTPTYRPPSKALRKDIRRCHLRYDAPLYGPHMSTIMGAFRPNHPMQYVREEMRAWDGCYVAMDWCYVEGETPAAYDHEHTSRVRKAGEPVDTAAKEPFGEAPGEAAVSSSSDNEMHQGGGNALADHFQAAKGEQGGGAAAAATEQRTTANVPFEQSPSASLPTHPTSDGTSNQDAQANSSESEFQKLTAGSEAVGVAFIVPGLTSHAQTNYVQHLVHVLHKANLHVCVLTTRGMGDSPPVTTPFLFNGAYTRDIRDCLRQFCSKPALTARFGHPLPLIGIGLSIGGMLLSKYVGEEGIAGADPHLDACLCACAPMDYVMTVEHMNRNGAQRALYQRDMCNSIRNYVLQYAPLQHMPNVDNDWVFVQGNVYRFRRVVHFDEHVVSKSAGYRSVHHYHVDASAMTWLPYTPIPTLVISTADDPVIGHTVMPHRLREMTRDNSRIVYVEPPVGGHLGFLSDPWTELLNKDNWLEVFVRDRVLAACDYWHAVQHRAEDVKLGGDDGGEEMKKIALSSTEAPRPSFPSSSPAVAPSTATPVALPDPSWCTMKVVSAATTQDRASGGNTCSVDGRESQVSGAINSTRVFREGGREELPAVVSGADASSNGEALVTLLSAADEHPARDHDEGRYAPSSQALAADDSADTGLCGKHEPIHDMPVVAPRLALEELNASPFTSPQRGWERNAGGASSSGAVASSTPTSTGQQPVSPYSPPRADRAHQPVLLHVLQRAGRAARSTDAAVLCTSTWHSGRGAADRERRSSVQVDPLLPRHTQQRQPALHGNQREPWR